MILGAALDFAMSSFSQDDNTNKLFHDLFAQLKKDVTVISGMEFNSKKPVKLAMEFAKCIQLGLVGKLGILISLVDEWVKYAHTPSDKNLACCLSLESLLGTLEESLSRLDADAKKKVGSLIIDVDKTVEKMSNLLGSLAELRGTLSEGIAHSASTQGAMTNKFGKSEKEVVNEVENNSPDDDTTQLQRLKDGELNIASGINTKGDESTVNIENQQEESHTADDDVSQITESVYPEDAAKQMHTGETPLIVQNNNSLTASEVSTEDKNEKEAENLVLRLQEKVTRLENDISSSEASIDEIKKEIQKFEKEIDGTQEEVTVLNQAVLDAQNELLTHEKTPPGLLKKVGNNVGNFFRVFLGLKPKLSQYDQTLVQLKNHLLEKKNELSGKKDDLIAKQGILIDKKNNLHETQRKHIELSSQRQSVATELHSAEMSMKEAHLTAQNARHQLALKEVEEAHQQKLEEVKQSAINERDGLKGNLHAEKQVLQARLENSEQAKQHLDAKLTKVQVENESLKKQILDLKRHRPDSLKAISQTLGTETYVQRYKALRHVHNKIP